MRSLKCGWFLGCKDEATVLVPHSLLGDVPACNRCAKRAGADLKTVKKVTEFLEGDGVLTLEGISAGRQVWRDVYREIAANEKKKEEQ